MKTIVVCATIFCLELVSAFPFPEPVPYYETYEQVPEQVQIPNIARSPDIYQQQLYIQQQNENIRRQNYENLLRDQDLNQRLASQILRPSYIQPVLNTVPEPYVNTLPVQRPIPQQFYQNVKSEPIRQYQAQSQYEAKSEAQAVAGNQVQQINNPYPQYPQYNAQNIAYHPRVQQVLASTPLKKRYLVLHPNGTIEHIDKIEHIVERHPNYILVNAGSVIPKPNEPVAVAQSHVSQKPAPWAPVAPVAPVAPTSPVAPVAPVAPTSAVAQANPAPASPVNPAPVAVPPVAPVASPVAPVTSPTAGSTPVNPAPVPSAPTNPVAPVPLPTIQNGTLPGPKPTVPPPTGPTTIRPPVSAPTAQPPIWVTATATAVYPPVPTTVTPVPPTVTPPKPTATPVPPTATPVPPTATPLPPNWVTATATAVYPPRTTVTPPPPTATPVPPTATPVPPTATPLPPNWVTATATAVYPPPTTVTPPPPTATPVPPTATPIPPVTATATANATSAPGATSPVSVTDAPEIPTTVAPLRNPCDPKNDIDVLHVNTGEKPVVWFRTKDLDFWKKLTSGNETYDVVYFFNVPREPRVEKETKTTIHADGTVVEEVTQTIYDNEDGSPPRVIKTTTVTKPDGSKSKT